jgi:hypothetical protein
MIAFYNLVSTFSPNLPAVQAVTEYQYTYKIAEKTPQK